jgi:hypothetical protein
MVEKTNPSGPTIKRFLATEQTRTGHQTDFSSKDKPLRAIRKMRSCQTNNPTGHQHTFFRKQNPLRAIKQGLNVFIFEILILNFHTRPTTTNFPRFNPG